MKRLFVGLSFEEKLGRDLEPWVKKLKKTADQKDMTLKWVPQENYHMTLVFLGDTDEAQIPEIAKRLDEVANTHAGFELKLRGLDAFPEITSARVIYLGAQKSQALLDLQSQVERVIQGEAKEDRGYVPHLTLARLRNPKSCRDLLSPFQHVDMGRREVRELHLYESLQAGPFPVYKKLHSAKLLEKVNAREPGVY